MQRNWLRLGNTFINLDNVASISESPTRFEIYFIDNANPLTLSRSTREARVLAHWLETSVAPMTDGTEGIPIA